VIIPRFTEFSQKFCLKFVGRGKFTILASEINGSLNNPAGTTSMMLKIYKYAILFGLMLPLSAWAQKVTVKGLVTNEDGEALPYIRVIGNRGQAGIETNDRGEYQLQLNRQDTLYLEFQAMDYEQKEIAIPRPTQDVVVQNVKLETIGVTLGVVTVTEQFRQRVEETTASLQTVSSKRLDQFANTNIIDAISMVPGVTIYDEQPSIRGSSGYTYGAGSRVLTLLNGLPMLSADRGSVTFDMLPTDNVAQVEVFKGATSVL
jgi:iron complex outermembrane receptor protein